MEQQIRDESTSSKEPQTKESEEYIDVTTERLSIYLAGYHWKSRNVMKYFLNGGIWENGHTDKFESVVKSVPVNSIIILKRKNIIRGNTLFIEKAGIVRDNPKNGTRLEVEWNESLDSLSEKEKTFPKLGGKYPGTIHEVTDEDYKNRLVDLLGGLNVIETWLNGTSIPNKMDKMRFHLDHIEKVDRLNREPIAKSLARLINKEIFENKKLQYSFMIHLQGKWGSGKSTFLNLIEKHLSSDKKKWVAVKFNAWQNQHVSPPWWSFINQVYRQSKERFKWYEAFSLWTLESYRRITWYSSWYTIISFVLTLIFFYLFFNYHSQLIEVLRTLSSTKNDFFLEDFTKLLLAIGTITGFIYSFSKFISKPLFMKSAEGAKSFVVKASDPMNQVKKHFKSLIGLINYWNYEVAVIIDDIDRCNRNYTVELLEGIQTLFREKRVLYIVAGDKNWIATCFENYYKEFADKVNDKNELLGDLFLEKVFQLSVRMPSISDNTKENYWNHILYNEPSKRIELSLDERNALKERIKEGFRGKKASRADVLEELATSNSFSESELSDIAIEALDEDSTDVKHLFSSHYKLINPNPRAIKRLANNYTIFRNILVAERKNFDPSKLFRWLIISDMIPKITEIFVNIDSLETLIKEINELKPNQETKDLLNLLIFDTNNEYGGQLDINNIRDILGV